MGHLIDKEGYIHRFFSKRETACTNNLVLNLNVVESFYFEKQLFLSQYA